MNLQKKADEKLKIHAKIGQGTNCLTCKTITNFFRKFSDTTDP